jgi:tetratricopeptide (TPR) repeat protein
MAYFLGDTSQVERGVITLNPLKHISWAGFIAFLIFGLGWPKSMQTNPYKLKRGYLDLFLVALSGPLASLTFGLATLLLTLTMAAALVYLSEASTDKVFPYLFRSGDNLPQTLNLQAISIACTGYLALASLALTCTSLLPLPGLDGFTAIFCLVAFVRERQKRSGSPTVAATAKQFSPPAAEQYQRRNKVADIHFQAGAQFHEGQQYDDAIARYQQAIRNDQYFGPAYVNLGLAYFAKGDRKKAIQAFRGATQYADDKKSQQEAWQQLQQLSEVPPFSPVTAEERVALGAAPWTDTQPRPNWLNLGIVSTILALSAIGLYSYLLTQLVKLLKA